MPPGALRAATGESPVLAAFTNGDGRPAEVEALRRLPVAAQPIASPVVRAGRGLERSRSPSRPGRRRAGRRRSRRPRPRGRSNRRRRRRSSARGGRGDVVGTVELEADDVESGARTPLDLVRPPDRIRVRRRAISAAQVGLWRGPRGPSRRSCSWPCARSRTASTARSPALPRSFRPRPGPRRASCRRPLRPPRGARKQEREDGEVDADSDYYGDGQRSPFPRYSSSQCPYPRPGRNRQLRARGRPGAARRLREPFSSRRIADVRRGLLGVHRRLHARGAAAGPDLRRRAARRRPARLDVVAERARHRRRGGLRSARPSPS